MKQAVVLQPFNDVKEGVFRKAGSAFLCDDERGLKLAEYGLVLLKEAPAKPVRKKK